MMIYSTTGCSETSVRRQERDYEATNMSRDELSVSESGREGRVAVADFVWVGNVRGGVEDEGAARDAQEQPVRVAQAGAADR